MIKLTLSPVDCSFFMLMSKTASSPTIIRLSTASTFTDKPAALTLAENKHKIAINKIHLFIKSIILQVIYKTFDVWFFILVLIYCFVINLKVVLIKGKS